MALAEKHPTDDTKYQSTFDSYGHGEGNGKSRNAVYKYAKRQGVKADTKKGSQTNGEKAEKDDFPEQAPSITIENEENEAESDFVQDESSDYTKWGSISWSDDSEPEGEVRASTIPKPIGDLAKGKQPKVALEATAQFVRYGYMALDRMLTHYGRGVMDDPEYSLDRTPSDYDALEAATVAAMQHYGIELPISPLLVLGATVGVAYVPPVIHIRRNADPNRKPGLLKRVWRRVPFIRGRRQRTTQNQGGENDRQPNN